MSATSLPSASSCPLLHASDSPPEVFILDFKCAGFLWECGFSKACGGGQGGQFITNSTPTDPTTGARRNGGIMDSAYMIDGTRNEAMIAIVLFRNSSWPTQQAGVCKIGESCESSRALLITNGNAEDRSQYHTYRVECYFNDNRRLEQALAANSYRVRYQEESVPVFSERTSSQNAKLTMCIPTLFGNMQLRPHFWFWVNEYIKFYEKVHHLEHIFIYTSSKAHFSLAKKFFAARDKLALTSPSTGVPVFINKASSRSWYRSQRLAIFDCFYRSASRGSDWIMFNDIDEVLEWPHAGFLDWDSVIPTDVTAISFPSWPFSIESGLFFGKGCAEAKRNGINRPSYRCDHCTLSGEGRRKYALRGDLFQNQHRPAEVHHFERLKELTSQRTQIGLNISGMSGIFRLKHLQLESSLLPLKLQYEATCAGQSCAHVTDFSWIGERTDDLLQLNHSFKAVFESKPNKFQWDSMKGASYDILS
eukprot:CAMPEP_0178505244 /NCGR_PEP_ID=MMETSP0696-20121128/19027_1 /TAXON_ID=265572 /ORGANISM="Extubocellulus spinifer, Strain CCMP396" /LENGTH=476 /DNA_ID=CAMNT_0020134541 /DNA_START=251 /DNA_END=1679 /DNA_ORIENTATION=-